MKAESRTAFSFLFFVVTTLISIAAISHGQSRQFEYGDARISMNFNGYLNKKLNKDILPVQQRISYKYMMMAAYFNRADVALPGFAEYFRSASDREHESVNFIMNYIHKRGGYIDCRDIERPDAYKWANGTDALDDALQMERELNSGYLNLVRAASNKGDFQMRHAIEERFLEEKVRLIKELSDNLAVLESMKGDNYGLGEYIFDKKLKS